MPNVIDLFAGAGGLSLGAARAGFDVVSAVEIEPHAIATHAVNFPMTRHIQKNMMELNGGELLAISKIPHGQLDGLIGGPPCQGFSNMGHRNVDDVRNGLFIKFFELVEETQPLFLLRKMFLGL